MESITQVEAGEGGGGGDTCTGDKSLERRSLSFQRPAASSSGTWRQTHWQECFQGRWKGRHDYSLCLLCRRYLHVGHLPLALVDVDGVVVDDAGESLETAVKGGRVEVLVVTALEVLGHHVLLKAELGSVVQVEGVDVVVEQHGLLLQLCLVTELSLPPPPLAHDGGGGEESPEGGQAERDEESQSSQGQESTEKSASSSAVVLLLALSLLVDIDGSSTASPTSTSCTQVISCLSSLHWSYRSCRRELRTRCSHSLHSGPRSHC